MERVKELRDKIADVDEEITQIEKGKNADSASLSQLKQQKASLMSLMKKAQDCMRKNLKHI